MLGLALGSGAAYGLAHIGVLRVLEKEEIPIDVVAGTSMGAMIAAMWASGLSANEIENIMMEYDNNKGRVFRLLGDLCFPKASLAKGNRVGRFLRKHLDHKVFSGTRMPLKIVACNLDKREKIIYESGTLVNAVRASIAIPGMFAPRFHKEDLVVDGGIMEPVPTGTLLESGAKKIIAVNVLHSSEDLREGYKRYKSYLEQKKKDMQQRNLIKRSLYGLRLSLRKMLFPNIFDIMVNSLLTMEHVMSLENCSKADVVINPTVIGTNWFEFFKTRELIKKGEEETVKILPKIKSLLG
ncbi:patatin-like phospholipase family protein [Candidatus Omnitrophota bacterium]